MWRQIAVIDNDAVDWILKLKVRHNFEKSGTTHRHSVMTQKTWNFYVLLAQFHLVLRSNIIEMKSAAVNT
jgi:hypothetical protein